MINAPKPSSSLRIWDLLKLIPFLFYGAALKDRQHIGKGQVRKQLFVANSDTNITHDLGAVPLGLFILTQEPSDLAQVFVGTWKRGVAAWTKAQITIQVPNAGNVWLWIYHAWLLGMVSYSLLRTIFYV